MSDLISRESLIKELNELRRYVPFPSSKDVFDIIMKAKAIAQGEPVAELKITWGSDTGYEYWLTLIGGALASQKAYDDWIVSNFKGEGVFPLYTTPQQAIPSVWQPIETAPKDGTEIDVWCFDSENEGYRVANAWYCNALNKWRSYGDNELIWANMPSYWMPLPASPTAPKEGE